MSYNLGPGPLTPEFEQVKSDIGIVENGNTATHAILNGQYVIWNGDLYVAKTDISSGTALSSSNLTAKTKGIGEDVTELKLGLLKKTSIGSYGTLADLESALATIIDSMVNGEHQFILAKQSSVFEPFKYYPASLWIDIYKHSSISAALSVRCSGTAVLICGNRQNGVFTWHNYNPGGITYFECTFNPVITDLSIRTRAASFHDPLSNVVHLNFMITSDSGLIPVANTTLCTVPNAYKPSTMRDLGFALVTPHDSSGWGPPYCESVRIESDGTVKLGNYIYGTKKVKALALNASYAI